jgi:hypothetical protein
MKKYVQQKNLKQVFDLSSDFFTSRLDSEFFLGVHYFIPPNSSRTKKAILWDVEAVDNWIRGHQATDPNDELTSLLNRR